MSEENENNVAGDQWPPESTQSPIIVPTVGRIVHFYENYQHGDNDPLAAIVAHVTNDRCVSLAVFSKWGGLEPRSNILLIQPGDSMPNPGGGVYATWMPYQIEQIEKKRNSDELYDSLMKAANPAESARLAEFASNQSKQYKNNYIPLTDGAESKEETLEDVISEATSPIPTSSHEDAMSEAPDDEPGIESGAPSGTYDGVKITPSAEEIRDDLDGEVIPGHQNGVSD